MSLRPAWGGSPLELLVPEMNTRDLSADGREDMYLKGSPRDQVNSELVEFTNAH